MMLPSRITKEWLKEENKEFSAIFISGSNLHPNPKFYKYYFWIYSLESKENSAADVFFKESHKLTLKEFNEEENRLQKNKISYAFVNIKYYRLGSIFNYEKLKKDCPDIIFAPPYEDDNDEMLESGHK